ncbi:MAG: flagellar export protein FliJ [Alcaligenaceae bacterium]
MPRTESAIHTLHALAKRACEKAATELAISSDQFAKAKEQVAMLETYRAEYLAQHVSVLADGIQSRDLLNFRDFLKNLDQIILTQQQLVDRTELIVQDKRVQWQVCERKKLSYQVLTEQEAHRLMIQENKRDQKLTDEFVNTRTAVNSKKKSMQ